MIDYSVIIPFADGLQMLAKAIDSVPSRDDIEVIAVDNAAVPASRDDIPARRDFTLLRSEPSRHAGGARNVGMSRASGRFLLFLDADDYFSDSAFDAFDRYLEAGYDITFFCPCSVRLSDGSEGTRHQAYCRMIDEFLAGGDAERLRYWFTIPVCKMISRDMVVREGLLFDECKASNDLMFSVRAGHAAKRIAADRAVVYVITEGASGSSLTTTASPANQFARFQAAVRQYKFMEEIGRPDQRFELMSFVLHALKDFGPGECLKYLRHARTCGVSVMHGFSVSKLFRRK